MRYDLAQTSFNDPFLRSQLLEEAGYTNKVKEEDSSYFNLKVKNKTYPSCYHYNLLMHAAKSLMSQGTR